MQFFACASIFLLGIVLPNAVATPVDTTSVDAAIAPQPDITCESGLNHNLGTSCHGNVGDFSCSSNNRGYIVCTDPIFAFCWKRRPTRISVLLNQYSSILLTCSSFNAKVIACGESTATVHLVLVAITVAALRGIESDTEPSQSRG